MESSFPLIISTVKNFPCSQVIYFLLLLVRPWYDTSKIIIFSVGLNKKNDGTYFCQFSLAAGYFFLTLYMVALPYGNKLRSCSFCNISRSNWAFYLKFSAKILQNKLLILSYFCRGCHKILLSYDEKFSKKKICNFCVFEMYSKRASFWYMEHRVKNEDFQKVYVKG